MSEWAPKRFWKQAEVTEAPDHFSVALDGRPVRTPAKATLTLPTRAMAQAVAGEWQAQGDRIDPLSMPVTRSANAAIDKVAHQHAEVAEMLAAYGDSDLLCYRADSPQELIQREAEAWDPYLDWADATFGARLEPRQGIMHAPQDAAALDRLRAPVHAMTAFQLAAFHDLVSLSGSLVLAFACVHNLTGPEEIWQVSRVDELYQAELWGADEEAEDTANRKKTAFLHAHLFFSLATPQGLPG
ncbi:ATP12 family chaperone protein [Thalassococcus sp. BH17M4-6]|uniref:ATP12 family chaperone protein n=1 Tax=Thalassococcus sp. BH17M4-6 TaxID=3413148 RepID=UPI003BCC8B9F